jgi:hypothetical protein
VYHSRSASGILVVAGPPSARASAGYADLRATIEAHGADGVEAFGGAVGAVAHVAYHLGAIRQKVAHNRKP